MVYEQGLNKVKTKHGVSIVDGEKHVCVYIYIVYIHLQYSKILNMDLGSQ